MSLPDRPDNLALDYQEFLTAVVRLRRGRQVETSAEAFRANVREALRQGDEEARRRGYSDQEIQLGRFAVVAFLDESVLNSRNEVFAGWARKPLQEELFGVHVAGEIFFQNVERLLRQPDSERLADVLEVYHLCLLLGFGGRYSKSGGAELRAVRDQLAERIDRIRGNNPQPVLPPPPIEGLGRHVDPWVGRLGWLAVACAVLVLVLFGVFHWSLSSGAGDVREIALKDGARR